jgi:hypothetical protein
MLIDFEHVADRLTIFGVGLMNRLSQLADVPGSSLRLTGLRSGSSIQDHNGGMNPIIAEFLVLPRPMEDPLTLDFDVHSATHSMELLSSAVSKNTGELCSLAWSLHGCHVELNDLGFAMPSLYGFKALPVPLPEQQPDQESQQAHGIDVSNLMILGCAVAAAGLLLCLRMARSLKTKKSLPDSSSQPYEVQVQAVVVGQALPSMEQCHEKPVEPVEQDIDKSTVCPSEPSEASFYIDIDNRPVDIENASSPEQGLSVVKAASLRKASR